jgi:hypothetical protein
MTLNGCDSTPLVNRRQLLTGLGAAALLLGVPGPAAAAPTPLRIRRRSVWGAGLPPTGPLEEERARDVRFILVHHTASSNDYSRDSVVDQLRGIYRYHTGTKGWPDVAYNFFVDRFGRIWEARSGSRAGPVKGSATGGSQGFALLCCFLGDHDRARPTPEARRAMTYLVAALTQRYGIDTTPSATATFVSRGSNRWPRGERVTTPTIAAHRDMSMTACPGRYGYRFTTGRLRDEVARLNRAAAPATHATAAVRPVTERTLEMPAAGHAGGPLRVNAKGADTAVTTAPASAPSRRGADNAVPITLITGGVAAAAVGVARVVSTQPTSSRQ